MTDRDKLLLMIAFIAGVTAFVMVIGAHIRIDDLVHTLRKVAN